MNTCKHKEINHNIAYRIGDTIYYNKHLKKYPAWFNQIMDHENRHTGKFTLKDFLMDFFEGNFLKTILFCIRHPFALSYFIPLSRHNNEWAIDLNLILNYSILIITMLLLILLIKNV